MRVWRFLLVCVCGGGGGGVRVEDRLRGGGVLILVFCFLPFIISFIAGLIFVLSFYFLIALI